MKLIYKGKYNGDETSLPTKEHEEGAVKFKEPGSMKKLAVIANTLSIAIMVICFALYFFRLNSYFEYSSAAEMFLDISFFGMLASVLSAFPHEFLHAICFKDEVYLYTNLKQGLLFVVGTENMSKSRFVFLSLLPNLVFGFVPFILFMIYPVFTFAGSLGAMAIAMGAGDYMNVFNCLTQVPKGGKIYMHGMNSYWFTPKKGD